MSKKIIIILPVLFILFYVCSSSYYSVSAVSLSEMFSQANAFVNAGEKNSGNITPDITPIVNIGSILTTIGVAVMLGVVAYMGIKYLTGGADAKAKLKTQLIGVVVSGIVIFGAYEIWSVVIDVFSKF